MPFKLIHSFVVAAVCSLSATAQTSAPPRTWVDRDTGHRIWRLTDEPGSSAFYFNVNGYSPDDRFMIYTAPDGIHTLELETRKTRLLAPNPALPSDAAKDPALRGRYTNHAVVVGHKTDSIFFTRTDPASGRSVVYKADMISGAVTTLATLPERASIATINADETLGAGVYDEHPTDTQKEYGRNSTAPAKTGEPQPLFQPEDKGAMMERRLASRIPVVLFTVDLASGKVHELLHSTDWIGHMLFSPIDPSLLMYCHEGPWQKVDRIWTIRADGTHNELIHKRTMLMEIAGHEFWGIDGETIWYDWQLPKGEDFFLAGYNLATHKRVAYHMQRDEWSIHFNVNKGATLFTGDGGDPGQVARAGNGEWIELFHPEWTRNNGGLDEPQFITPGVLHAERLVNMKHHNYRLEPNVRFSPDAKLVLFTSNMFGPSYVFAVEVEKAPASATDVLSTPDLGRTYGPDPLPTNCTKDRPCNAPTR
ncbi:oligogalacturonate lyase family protein [Terriglobus roseus]|uniref:Oligogalacturonide lyase n=1 Tax=Terriglobus roseus TaxID=392734 RepID=A0A1H4SHA4_9BACT|nr:oligogalacturonate lyase family protein [Terriglobus roseus]SEC43211.1 oligogalacturonide lyase [Terriglobus roseus]